MRATIRDNNSAAVPLQNRPPSCPICNTANPTAYALGRDRLFGVASGRFTLLRCPGCGCIFQHPLPSEEELARYYPDEYWWPQAVRTRSSLGRAVGRLENWYREFVTLDHVRFLERCARGRASGRAVLDIGCGSGTFLHLTRLRGFQAHGMDASERAVNVARQQYGLDVRQGSVGSDVWEEKRFDFVTMFHVLEHVSDPRKALQHACSRLKPEGSLILQVPNVRSLQARVFASRWYGLDVPRHVINYSPNALKNVLAQAGLQISAVKRFSLRDNPASIASSLVPGLDPLGRRVRKRGASLILESFLELAYFVLCLLSLPFALAESACGCGGTLWVQARRCR